MRARMGCPPWAKDCRPLRPASGSDTRRRAPRHVGRIPNRARKPVQVPALARVVTDRPVTTLAGERGARGSSGGAREALRPELTHRDFRGSGSAGLRGPVCAPSRARGSADCGDGALFQLRRMKPARRCSWDADRCASRTRPIALYDVLRRRRATRVAEVADLLTLHAPFALPGLVATLPPRNSG